MQPPLRSSDDQDPKLRLTEQPREITRDGQLEILAGLLLPDPHGLMAEIDLKKHRADHRKRLQFKVSIRHQPGMLRVSASWKTLPAYEPEASWQGRNLSRAVNVIDVHLVVDIEIADQRLPVAAADRPVFGAYQMPPLWGQRVDRLAAGSDAADKESVEQTRRESASAGAYSREWWSRNPATTLASSRSMIRMVASSESNRRSRSCKTSPVFRLFPAMEHLLGPLSSLLAAGTDFGFNVGPLSCPTRPAAVIQVGVIDLWFGDGGHHGFPEAFVTALDHHVALGQIL